MTSRPTCVCCGQPMADGAYACQKCGRDLAQALTEAAGHAEDAARLAERGTRINAGRSGGGTTPLPDLIRAKRHQRATDIIVGWTLTAITGTGRRPRWRPAAGPICAPARPGDEPRDGNRCDHGSCETIRRRTAPSAAALHAAWLAQPRQITWLRKHPDAGEAFAALHDASHLLARLVDVPPDKELVGMCDCGKVLYAVHDRAYVTCPEPRCKLRWNVTESRDILRRALRDKLVTAADASRLAAHWDDRTSDQIRKLINKWAQRSRLIPHGHVEGLPAFLFGEVIDRLAESPRRTQEVAA